MQRCKGAKLTAEKNKVTHKQTDKQSSKVTSSLLELLVAAKNAEYHYQYLRWSVGPTYSIIIGTSGQRCSQLLLDPVGHFGAPGSHFGFGMRCDFVGSEQVPLASLGWCSLFYLLFYKNH